MLLELPAAFAGNNFDQFNALVHGLLHNAIQLIVNGAAFVINVVQIEL